MAVDWSAPDFSSVWADRAARLERIRSDPAILPGLVAHYKDRPAEFITDWGCTFDPRNAEIRASTVMPFVLFPRQAEFIGWLVERWRNREDGLAEKSRDMGASWLCVSFAHWMWHFHPGTVVGFGSRKEEYVDDLNDPKALFWKLRKYIELLPPEFRPAGWNPKKHAPYMAVVNPANGSAIVGEAGDNIGRGNRTAIYFKDESAYYDRPESIEAALSQTSNCKIDISTPNGNGNPFYRRRHSGKVPVFTFHWRDDPRKGEAWYAKQVRDLDPIVLAQEVDIDYNASSASSWIDGSLVEQAQANGPANVEAVGPWMVGVDAAHFGDDESVIHRRKGRLNLPQIARRGIDGVQLAAIVEDECDTLGGEKAIGAIIIELDGPGVSCFDQLRQGRYADVTIGVHTGARVKDERNYNLRARMWRKAQDYLEDHPVSLARDPEFKSQIASVKYKYKDGQLLMQSKKEYKADTGKSPDRADAFVLTFASDGPAQRKRKTFDATEGQNHSWQAT